MQIIVHIEIAEVQMHAMDKFYELEEGYAPVSTTACLLWK